MRFVYLYFFLWLPHLLISQSVPQGSGSSVSKGWQELTIADGLSQGMVFDMQQDKKGFIWIATKDGLNRYNGYTFKVFSNDPYNSYSLSDNACSALLIDKQDRLWIGTLNKGLNLYDDRTQRFYHIVIRDPTQANGASYEISTLTEDPEGNIWVGTSVGRPFKITLPPSLRQGFPDQADLTNQVQVSSIHIGSGQAGYPNIYFSFRPMGEALTGLDNGIYAFNWRKPSSLTRLNLFANETQGIVDLYEDTVRDFLFVCTKKSIHGWYQGKKKAISIPAGNDQGVRIKPIDTKTLAITTVSYLWLLSPEELFRKDSLTEQDAFMTFPPDLYAVTKVMRDKTGNIWVGTSGYGIRKFNPKVNQFHSYLPGVSLSQLYVDQQGRIYGRYQYAYGQLDQTTNQLLPFLDPILPEADRRQRYFMQDRQGFFWVSNAHFQTHDQTLFKFSNSWQLLKKYPLPAKVEFGLWGNCTLEDPAGYLWIGAKNGKLLRFDPTTETFQQFTYIKRSSSETETYALLREPDGAFWIGSQQGLVKAENLSDNPTYTLYKNSTATRQSLSNDFVLSLANDPYEPTRYLWIGTKGGGLDRLDKQTGQFTHFTEAQGLPNKVVYGILVDEFKHLWLSTNRGLAQFNPKSGHFRNYTRADGLQDNEFNTSAFFKAPSGELLFGGIKGLNIVRPSELAKSDPKRPSVNLLGLRINNKPVEVGDADGVLTQSIDYTRQLDLRHDQNLLTFEFGVMDYTNAPNNRYRYRLDGIDDDWIDAGTNRFANYAQLPSGTYQLQMMGSVDGEHWSKPLALSIRIRPPFYRTWWAYLFYLTLVLFIIWQLYRFQTQRLLLQQQVAFEQKEAGRLAELDVVKTRFFTNLSHEFRTPLTLLLGPLNDLRQRNPADTLYQAMYRNASRLYTLIGQLLDLARLEAGQLQLEVKPGNLAEACRVWVASFESLAQSRGIALLLTQDKCQQWMAYDADKLEKIITNLISNALKFTPAGGRVLIEVAYEAPNPGVQLCISDTGVGIAAEHLSRIFDRFYQPPADAVEDSFQRNYEGTGIGLALVKELVTVMNGQIRVDSQPNLGTTFYIDLPLVPIAAPADQEPPAATTVALTDGIVPVAPAVVDNDDSSRKMVLIIEDNDDLRMYIRHVLEPTYLIAEAIDGQDGLRVALDKLPDLVICDLMMPRLDGFGFCRQLKTQEATSHIPVVMLTAKADMESRLEGLTLGADDYLTKPFDRQELLLRMRNLLQQRERLFAWFVASKSQPEPTLPIPAALTAEQRFLDRLSKVVDEQLGDPAFTVEALAEAVNLSRVQLHRKLKALMNTTATNFIRDVRLQKASELLIDRALSVTQVAYMVGFDNLSYFSKVFQEKYGVLPSQYKKTSLSES